MPCNRQTINCKIVRGQDRPLCCITIFKQLLFYIDKLFTEHDIIYWIDYGTLLGAVRDGAMIPWDTDIDIGILAPDIEKIFALENQMREDGFDFVAHPLTRPERLAPYCMLFLFYSKLNRLNVDMSVWVEIDDGILRRSWYGKGERAIGKDFKKSLIFPMGEISMYGRNFKCPNDVNTFLSYRYGPKYMTPKRV